MVAVADIQTRQITFRRLVLANLRYWQGWLNDNMADPANLDQALDGLVRCFTFGFELDEAWETIYDLIIKLSPLMERRGHRKTWREVLSKAMRVAKHNGDGEKEANLSALVGLMLQRRGRFKEAIIQHRYTIRVAKQAGNTFALARTYTNLGFIFCEQGHWYRAEVLCQRALTLFEQVGSDFGLAHTWNHLGVVRMRRNRLKEAHHHFDQACRLWESTGDNHGLMRGHLNISTLFLKDDQQQPEKALEHLENALQYATRTGERPEFSIIYQNMGLAYALMQDWTNSEAYYNRALAILQQFPDYKELARIKENLGLLYLRQKRWQDAHLNLEESLAIWHTLGSKISEIDILFELANCELAQDNKARAGLHLKTIRRLIGESGESSLYNRFHSKLNEYDDLLSA